MILFQPLVFFFIFQIFYPLLCHNIVYCYNNNSNPLYFIYTVLSMLPLLTVFLEFIILNNKNNIYYFCFLFLCFPFLFLLKDLVILHIYSDSNVIKYTKIMFVRTLCISDIEDIFKKEYKNPNVIFSFLDKKELIFSSKLIDNYEVYSHYLIEKERLILVSREKYHEKLEHYLSYNKQNSIHNILGYNIGFFKPIFLRMVDVFLTSIVSSYIDSFFLKNQNNNLIASLEDLRNNSNDLHNEINTQLTSLNTSSLNHKKLLDLYKESLDNITSDIHTIVQEHNFLDKKVASISLDSKQIDMINDEVKSISNVISQHGLDTPGMLYSDHVRKISEFMSFQDEQTSQLLHLLENIALEKDGFISDNVVPVSKWSVSNEKE